MKWKVTALLALIGLPGVAATSWLALPLLTDTSKLSVPLETLQIATMVQGAITVLIAALVGATLAPKVGLATPAIAAIIRGDSFFDALRPQLTPGLVGGCVGAPIILAFYALAPTVLVAIQPETPLPLLVRVLYGGVTEEVLVRWGLMTTMVWAGWKATARGSQQPSSWVVWVAIVLSALIFGASHLPLVAQSLSTLSAYVAAYIIIGNALFGIVAGYLFWRYGLEAAIVAHTSAHVLAFIVLG